MPDRSLIRLLSLLFIILGGGSAYPQMPPQDMQQGIPPEAAAPQPGPPESISSIVVKDNLLSVEIAETNFGEVIQTIAAKAGFSLAGNSDAFSKKITTKFSDLEIDRGLMRLFSLVKENNYLINYSPEGSISRLEIYTAASVGSFPQTPAGTQVYPARPQIRSPYPVPSPNVPQQRMYPRRAIPQPAQTVQPPPQQMPPAQVPENQDTVDEAPPVQDSPAEDVREIPYIPPQRKPVYIPPIKR